MTITDETATGVEITPHQHLFSLAMSAVVPRALQVVADLGVADAIDDGATVGVEDIAAAAGIDATSLHRVLRVLEPHGLFERHGRSWSHTTASTLLRTDHPATMRPFARVMGLPLTWDCVSDLAYSVTTGRPVMDKLDGGSLFGYLAAHPDQRAVFDASMTAKSAGDIPALLEAVDFAPFTTVCDVGGGVGHLLHAILDRHEHISGTVFELPHVAADVVVRADRRLSAHAGDFFTDPVPGADLSVLMHVIHDWDDESAERILRAVAAGNEPGSALILFEALLPDDAAPHPVKMLDLIMLSCTGGRERTVAEYRHLLDAAGYDLAEVTSTYTGMCAIRADLR